jgi:hypothetical protein
MTHPAASGLLTPCCAANEKAGTQGPGFRRCTNGTADQAAALTLPVGTSEIVFRTCDAIA